MSTNTFLILLGTNIDSEINLNRTKAILGQLYTIKKLSKIYITRAIKKGLPDFLNQALIIETALDLKTLKKEINSIEAMQFREGSDDKFQSKTIDIAIYAENGHFYDKINDDMQYEQILISIADIMPNAILPNGQTIRNQYKKIQQHKPHILREKNKTVLITGSALRIGRYLAMAFAKNGYDIIAHYNTSESEAIELKKIITMMGRKCILWQQDFSKRKISTKILDDQKVDLLINSAATYFSDNDIKKNPSLDEIQFCVNYSSPKTLIEKYAQVMDEGHIINFLDQHIDGEDHVYSRYLSTKKKLNSFAVESILNHMPNFRINAIAPGWILTPVGQEALPYVEIQRKIKEKKLKRKGDVADIINTALYLEHNSFINGQIIFVDGGRHLL